MYTVHIVQSTVKYSIAKYSIAMEQTDSTSGPMQALVEVIQAF